MPKPHQSKSTNIIVQLGISYFWVARLLAVVINNYKREKTKVVKKI